MSIQYNATTGTYFKPNVSIIGPPVTFTTTGGITITDILVLGPSINNPTAVPSIVISFTTNTFYDNYTYTNNGLTITTNSTLYIATGSSSGFGQIVNVLIQFQDNSTILADGTQFVVQGTTTINFYDSTQ